MLILAALIIEGYTNHAGNVVKGWPVKFTPTQVVLVERTLSTTNHQPPAINYLRTTSYSLLIFPESDQRRIAAGFGEPRVPVAETCGQETPPNIRNWQMFSKVQFRRFVELAKTARTCDIAKIPLTADAKQNITYVRQSRMKKGEYAPCLRPI